MYYTVCLRSFHHNVTAELISISRLQTRFYLLTSYLSLFNEHQMTCDPGPPGATCLTDPGPGDQLSALRELPPISDPGTNHRLLLTHWSLHWPRCSGAPGCYCYISCEPVIPVLTFSNKIGTGSWERSFRWNNQRMEDNYINELDKEFKKSRWLRGGPGGKENREMRDVRDMSGSSHSSDSHGVYSAYSNIGGGSSTYVW